tara:strand:- start:402 stop:614 length:213 start_codon:yes stop_codon:yes gene_type:complete
LQILHAFHQRQRSERTKILGAKSIPSNKFSAGILEFGASNQEVHDPWKQLKYGHDKVFETRGTEEWKRGF